MNNYVCNLSVRRNLAPATTWHWAVEMPDGHIFKCSKGEIENLPDVIADASTSGVEALKQAESIQAQYDPKFAKAIGFKGITCFEDRRSVKSIGNTMRDKVLT